ncbi:MAG TPA: hypothetical protein VLY04_22180 [Bryobacteraceae bacterium]|nr:hypothetical protein [Bryobacteraceae bacterium]
MIAVWIIVGLVLAVFLALRLAPVCIRWLDRAPGNDRTLLPYSYEIPRYFVRGADGRVDTGARWPGWDSWTACAIPADPGVLPQMVRGSLMTGLYGLDGVDNYEKLMYRLSSYQAVEHLSFVPTSYALAAGGTLTLENLSQNYLPKPTDLRMADAGLDVAVLGSRTTEEETTEQYGRVSGTWPDYRFTLLNPESEIRVALECHARRIVWWTDIPGFYTHYAAFGTFEADVEYARGATIADPHRPIPNRERLRFQARGALEHVSSAKPFGFDWLWLPMRLLGRHFPSLKPILYHHEVIVAAGIEGGFVHARAFGVDLRNTGGFFAGDAYHSVKHVSARPTESDPVDNCGGRGALMPVWRKWDVRAVTDAGDLAYSAERTHPPAMTGSNTNQYHFRFEGTWCGAPVSGRGYGEYAHL